jgi:hypothetical protein
LSALENKGVLVLNMPDMPQAEKTVVVLGVARSGTSMVASVLEALGIQMGEKLGPVFEDVSLSKAIEQRDLERLSDILVKRDSQHSIWGWKRPSALKYYDVWKDRFRNPYVIAIFRDPFAIANRNRISMMSDLFKNMEQSTQQLADLIRILGQKDFPLLLCSYEKVLGSPERFVQAVDGFLEINVPDRWEYAASRINPGPRRYLQSSRVTHSKGRLSIVDNKTCRGWAYYTKLPKRVAKVQVFLNGVLVNIVDAKMPRPDLKEKGIHPTGQCGFRLDWPDNAIPEVGDWVDVRVEGDIESLNGSPKQVGVLAHAKST